MTTWSASAPANIALIKYMGKVDNINNIPSNPSLSYTLEHLRSLVELELTSQSADCWQPLSAQQTFKLNTASQQRYLQHLARLKQYFGFSGHFIVRSNNNFPANAGIASSASSFAALTLCACQALSELNHKPLPYLSEQAQLSAKGSGSSCRSFFQPWVLWQNDTVQGLDLPYPQLEHQVIVVAEQAKAISSSEAHRRVSTSLLFKNRPERATARLQSLINCLQKQDWPQAFEIVWQEFWDMHALFETAASPFGYFTADTLFILNYIRTIWQQHSDGPLITIDAGPNVHLLFRPDQIQLKTQIKHDLQHYTII